VLERGLQPWHSWCQTCGYEHADLRLAINETAAHAELDESARARALIALRLRNFKELLKQISIYKTVGGKLLDVGCANGWFLDLSGHSFDATGIEPDRQVFAEAAKGGRSVRLGYFPDALQPNEKFDVIVFNDVIEHIPDIQTALADCIHRLNQEGLLVLNLPSSKGVFYRLSKWLCRFGLIAPFGRMWQVGLPSPHVHYFHLDNLASLLHTQGYVVKKTGRLASVHFKGLYSRVVFTKVKRSFIKGAALYLGIVCLLPILRILPSDIIYVIAQPLAPAND
jgi:SAM-dependent methyltransferase